MDMSEEESLDFFSALSKNHNKEYESIITSVMLRCMLADFEQNIFRLAIRNYSNTETVHIWTFYNFNDSLYSELSSMIEERYKPYGTIFEYEDSSIGFGANVVNNQRTIADLSMVEQHDFVKYGLMPELIGRLPIITVLNPLSENDLVRILTEPKNAITKQYRELLSMDGVKLCLQAWDMIDSKWKKHGIA